MSETEWLESSDFTAMYLALRIPRNRSLAVLFGAACIRSTPAAMGQPSLVRAVEAVERAADGGDWTEVEALHKEVRERCEYVTLDSIDHDWALAELRLTDRDVDMWAMHVPFYLNKAGSERSAAHGKSQLYAEILRDVAWRPTSRPGRMKRPRKKHPYPVLIMSHITSDVRTLAEHIYESRDFSAMPILADALQDAGCIDAHILDHCRRTGEHVRGCWVLDLVLAKR